MIDTHAHLDSPDYDADREAVIERAHAAGVHTIIAIATDLESSDRVLALADSHPSVYAAVGVHPHEAKAWEGATSAARLRELAKPPKVVAIGEIGLDYFRDHSPRAAQERAFRDQVQIARELELPIIIHNREAWEDILHLVEETDAAQVGGVFHCFAGSPEDARRIIDLGFHISVNGILTYKNAGMAAVVQHVPADSILLETDCPYLTPHPYRGRRNEPAHVSIVAGRLAELRGVDPTQIERETDANATSLFGLAVRA
ncbi:MAG: TatD family hydrolase [candidate division Zixibacteria bacterium]|nr:TatD family hydrolase [candidate division Zixibacteria bacterium]